MHILTYDHALNVLRYFRLQILALQIPVGFRGPSGPVLDNLGKFLRNFIIHPADGGQNLLSCLPDNPNPAHIAFMEDIGRDHFDHDSVAGNSREFYRIKRDILLQQKKLRGGLRAGKTDKIIDLVFKEVLAILTGGMSKEPLNCFMIDMGFHVLSLVEIG